VWQRTLIRPLFAPKGCFRVDTDTLGWGTWVAKEGPEVSATTEYCGTSLTIPLVSLARALPGTPPLGHAMLA
jgi:hypothetical protein